MRHALSIAAAAIGFAALTALAFLVRAGDPGESNWPVTWELRSSDNGVLFQLMQDIFAGRTLDWSFSPQVYVFPEMPISAVAFVLAAGNVYVYYLLVAAINNALLFLAILAVVRLVFTDERLRMSLARAALAATPLVLFPLIGTAWILSQQLAPTYYFGLYLVLFAAPVLLLARRWWVRVAVGVGIALTVASNPLLAVFTIPAFGVVAVIVAVGRGIRSGLRLAVPVGLVLLAALVVRIAFFIPLQGKSPFAYVDAGIFAERFRQLWPHFAAISSDLATRMILTIGAALAILCLLGAITAAVLFLRRRTEPDVRLLVGVYFGLVPLGGLACTLALLITHYLYFWPVLIAPFVIVLMALPTGWIPRLVPFAAAGLVVAALVTGVVPNLPHEDRYFGYRNPETQCIDEGLPRGVTVGYATFSDARRLSLTSRTPFRLIQLTAGGDPSYWLTNRDYARAQAGQFFYINGRGDELPIDTAVITDRFGEPDDRFSCGEAQEVLVYTDATTVSRIAQYYGAGG